MSVEWDILAVPATRNEEYLTSDRGDDELEEIEDQELKEEFRGKLFTGNKRIIMALVILYSTLKNKKCIPCIPNFISNIT